MDHVNKTSPGPDTKPMDSPGYMHATLHGGTWEKSFGVSDKLYGSDNKPFALTDIWQRWFLGQSNFTYFLWLTGESKIHLADDKDDEVTYNTAVVQEGFNAEQ